MNVFFNGNEVSIDNGTSLHELLLKQKIAKKKGIAVAVNNDLVVRNSWSAKTLNDNDKILVISATKGG